VEIHLSQNSVYIDPKGIYLPDRASSANIDWNKSFAIQHVKECQHEK
jgi:hypothetical protein